MYYLQSRYYDSAIGRFISADAYAMTYESPIGANMYAYCGNNPVACADDGGEWAHIAIGAAIGAAISVATNYLFAVQNGDSYSVKDAVVDAVSGAISGGLAASGVGAPMQVLANGFISASATLTKGIVNDKPVSSAEIVVSACAGMVSGFVGGNGLSMGSNAMKHMKILNSKPKISTVYSKSFNAMSKEMSLAQSKFIGGAVISNLITSWHNDVGYKLFN